MAGHLPPALAASFESGRCLPILMLRVDLPAIDPVLLLYGSGEVVWDGGDGAKTYVGKDSRFGSLVSLDPPEDGLGNSAPTMSFEMAVPNSTAAALLSSPSYQGSRSRLWVGGLDPVSGVPFEPYPLFDGTLDRPLLKRSGRARTVEFECGSGYEKFFTDSEGQRLADASHQAVWPGELGLVHITGVTRTTIWGPGERPPSTSTGTYSGGFSVGEGRLFNARGLITA